MTIQTRSWLQKSAAGAMCACLLASSGTPVLAAGVAVREARVAAPSVSVGGLGTETSAAASLGSALAMPDLGAALPTLGLVSGEAALPAAQAEAISPALAPQESPVAAAQAVAAPLARRSAAPADAGERQAARTQGAQAVAGDFVGVRDALNAAPNVASLSVSSAHGAGVAIDDAVTRQRSRSGEGDVSPVAALALSEGPRPALAPASLASAAASAGIPAPRGARARAAVRSLLPAGRVPASVMALGGVALTVALLVTQAWVPAALSSMGLLLMTGTLQGRGDDAAREFLGKLADGSAEIPAKAAPAPLADEPAPEAAPAEPSPQIKIGDKTAARAEFVAWAGQNVAGMKREIGKVIVGQEEMIDAIILSAVAGEHILLEGLPGMGKTKLVNAFARTMQASFNRIQLRSDLMPADIIGTEIPQTGADGRKTFEVVKGPIFTQILLADEINRTPPKTQSAMLEPMQERQVTIGKTRFPLDKFFLVLATQNPIEQEGTYPLPEAQQDRFMFKFSLPQLDPGDPATRKQLQAIAELNRKVNPEDAQPIMTPQDMLAMGEIATHIHMSPEITEYYLNILEAAIHPERYGMEGGLTEEQRTLLMRANIYFAKAARVHALMQGREFVTPDDVQAVAPLILRHRVPLSFAASAHITVEDFIQKLLQTVPVKSADANRVKSDEAKKQDAAAKAKIPPSGWKVWAWRLLKLALVLIPLGAVALAAWYLWPAAWTEAIGGLFGR
ncbi:MAG TPA: MoxR family ATPase [Elusimicrobiota bacterium]|nr:MoxR family ATPase [Elusimicrobiota bacterium]